VLAVAEQRFTRTIDLGVKGGASFDTIVNFARVGRAKRVRLDLGKADAAADARLVPNWLVVNATYGSSPLRRQNAAYVQNYLEPNVSVDPRFRNLTVGGVPTPVFA
jgi:hypothetical protein